LTELSMIKRGLILLVGATGSGKSSLIFSWKQQKFCPQNSSTEGAAFHELLVKLEDDRYSTLKLWETSGQTKYQFLIPIYLKGAQILFVVFDICSRASWISAKQWISDIEKLKLEVVVVMIGNKADLKREVTREDIDTHCKPKGLYFFETSAHDVGSVNSVLASALQFHLRIEQKTES